MKKLLALVLALVMTLGLATVSSSAAYSDAADVSLKEAVDVMSAVGVFQGSDGKFSPKANLNREQAAKLIAYLDLGESAAEALPAVKVFSDVPATSWSAKYIAYCADAGYIAGDGTGKFNPTGELNGYAFGKMLLCVLGYDADIEGFVGNTWSINVAKLMEKNNIADGIDSAASATLTREQAAQYCLNAIQENTVTYASKGTNVTINGAVIATGASAASKKDENGNPNDTLKTKLYGTKLVKTPGTGDFGVKGNTWTYKSKKVGSYADETPVLTYTAELKEKALFTDLGVDGITATSTNPKYIVLDAIYVDGVQVAASKETSTGSGQYTYVTPATTGTDANGYDTDYNNSVVVGKGVNDKLAGTGTGVTTMIYEVKNAAGDVVTNHYKMVIVNEYLGKVSDVKKANATTGAERYVTVDGMNFETEDFAKKDMVVYTKSGTEIKTMVAATTVEDLAVSAYTGSSVTAGGTTYKYNAKALDGTLTKYTMKSGTTYTFYLDSMGNILGNEEYTTTSTDYYLVKAASKPSANDFASDYTAKYQLVGMDGKVVTVQAIETFASIPTTGKIAANKIVTYKEDKDNSGCVVISVVGDYSTSTASTAGYAVLTNAKDGSNSIFKKTNATLAIGSSSNNVTLNNSTVFVVRTGSNSYKVVNGLSAMDNWTKIAADVYTVTKDNVAQVAYIDCYNEGKAETTNSADELVYIVKTAADVTYNDDLDENINTYKTTGDPVSAIAKYATDSTTGFFSSKGLWKISGTESGFVKAASEISNGGKYVIGTASTAVEVKYDDGVLTIGTASYVLASNVSVTIVDGSDVTADASASDLVGNFTGKYTMIKASDTDSTIKTIYFDGTID